TGRQADMQASVLAIERGARLEGARVRALVEGYDEVALLGRSMQSVTALERQGALYEGYVRTVLGTRFDVPRDVDRQLRSLPPAERQAAHAQIGDSVRAQLDTLVRPIECAAVERYLLATRLARRDAIASDAATRAMERLHAYGQERVAECAAQAHARDASFAPYGTADLDRARPGQLLPPAEGVAPPALEQQP
ncbi:MAG: hypothetical protein IT378_07550, partial [Sandaracinaceae bacterium]|nr:hypothetical protein [Sandaracinaceae bacterium]